MTGWLAPRLLCDGCACAEGDEDLRPGRTGAVPIGLGSQLPREVRPPARAPKARELQTYSCAPDQQLLGLPIREGELWHLSAQDRFEHVSFSLYVNGFSFCTPDGCEATVALSPFSLVRNCRFQSGECSKLKSLKVSLMEPEPCCYFAVRGGSERDADEERSDWVLGLSHTILLITDSLLPEFSITCDPLPHVPQTARRLMAGYLIYRNDASTLSVVYCELHAHTGITARFSLYENELCERPMTDILITDSSECKDVVGINCSCFMIDHHSFAAQTPSERKLWLRALSNVKVKIQNRAPQPSAEELWYYRLSIREHIVALEATLEPRVVADSLLARCPPKPLQLPDAGDSAETDSAAQLSLVQVPQATTANPASQLSL